MDKRATGSTKIGDPIPDELRRLLEPMFGVSQSATDADFLAAGKKFMGELEALSANVEQVLESRLSGTDRKVCQILGLKPSEFLKI